MSPKSARRRIESLGSTIGETMKQLSTVLLLLSLAALISPVSQSAMIPVYGSITCAVNHKEAMFLSVAVGFLVYGYATPYSNARITQFAALWALFLPNVTKLHSRLSGFLGPVGGPITLGLMSCHSIVISSAWTAARILESFRLRDRLGRHAGTILPALGGALLCSVMERGLAASLPQIMASFPLLNPAMLELSIASALALLSSSFWLPVAYVAIVQALLLSPYGLSLGDVSNLNASLASQNWTVLDRAWSTTGYISVLESNSLHYRVLRCDHSLLGGEWLLTNPRVEKENWKVNEPIYSVFAMLEAVRLVELSPQIPDPEAKALAIGLGIGTAPAALIKHGIDTTIVELDPTVHKFATTYFALPSNHTAVLSDAVAWVAAASQSSPPKQYDYILHDVFTGGAEPLSLFTLDFLTQLRALLTPNGVLALNYAGDLSLPLTRHVLHTITTVFDHQCKAFRDTQPPSDSPGPTSSPSSDFLNMVLFCRNSPGPLTFRRPTARDFLASKSRAHYLLPRPDWELELAFPMSDAPKGGSGMLRAGDEHKWRAQQVESAKRHWRIMRGVLPHRVWEQY
nr:polyamine aminopropyltransferase [Quercus suber]